jgi:hypothetical protein
MHSSKKSKAAKAFFISRKRMAKVALSGFFQHSCLPVMLVSGYDCPKAALRREDAFGKRRTIVGVYNQ